MTASVTLAPTDPSSRSDIARTAMLRYPRAVLIECLDIARIRTGMNATQKENALRQLAELLIQPEHSMNAEAVYDVLADRERLASTGVGSGVAVPHGRMHDASGLRAAVAIFPGGVEFDAVDGLPVNIVVGILGPRTSARQHLALLAEVSRIMRQDQVRAALAEASDADSVYELLLDAGSRQVSGSAV